LTHDGAMSELKRRGGEIWGEGEAKNGPGASYRGIQRGDSLPILGVNAVRDSRNSPGEGGGRVGLGSHGRRAGLHSLHSLEKFVRECDPKSKLLKVYKCPIPGLVQSVIKGLLHRCE
jgi:hypothetical protein